MQDIATDRHDRVEGLLSIAGGGRSLVMAAISASVRPGSALRIVARYILAVTARASSISAISASSLIDRCAATAATSSVEAPLRLARINTEQRTQRKAALGAVGRQIVDFGTTLFEGGQPPSQVTDTSGSQRPSCGA